MLSLCGWLVRGTLRRCNTWFAAINRVTVRLRRTSTNSFVMCLGVEQSRINPYNKQALMLCTSDEFCLECVR